jgi:broad specificity phosphatase PhoE
VLPTSALWVSSTEPKAVATAQLLTSADLSLDDGLREADRDPAWLRLDEFHALVLQSFAEPEVSVRDGWEPLEATRARVSGSARAAVERADGGDVVLVGHGTAWTMLIAGCTGQPPDVEAWQHLQMPDHCALEWPDRIARPWGSWAP